MPDPTAKQTSEKNNALLIELKSTVGTMGTQVAQFIAAQENENRRIHERIDAANAHTSRAVDGIKDALAQRGRLSPTLIIGIIATGISFATLVFGAGHAYVSMRLDAIKPQIDASVAHTASMGKELTDSRVEAAREAGRNEERARWVEKALAKAAASGNAGQ